MRSGVYKALGTVPKTQEALNKCLLLLLFLLIEQLLLLVKIV